MRSMRSQFETRFDAVLVRLNRLESHMESIEAGMDSVEVRSDTMAAHLESLHSRIGVNEMRNEALHQMLLERFDTLDVRFKEFAGLVNETILHYAEEMDSVRDRLQTLESRVGIPATSE